MFKFLRKLMDDIGTQPPEFHNGDKVRMKVNPQIRGQVRRRAVPVGFGAVSWDYDLRLPDGTLIADVRSFELELDR